MAARGKKKVKLQQFLPFTFDSSLPEDEAALPTAEYNLGK